ncbi:hypothetical protein Tco_0299368 [Tanacetum coccineum]
MHGRGGVTEVVRTWEYNIVGMAHWSRWGTEGGGAGKGGGDGGMWAKVLGGLAMGETYIQALEYKHDVWILIGCCGFPNGVGREVGVGWWLGRGGGGGMWGAVGGGLRAVYISKSGEAVGGDMSVWGGVVGKGGGVGVEAGREATWGGGRWGLRVLWMMWVDEELEGRGLVGGVERLGDQQIHHIGTLACGTVGYWSLGCGVVRIVAGGRDGVGVGRGVVWGGGGGGGVRVAGGVDTVMSDSEDFTVTYKEVSSLFEDLSDIGSPGVVGPGYEGLPWMLDDPYVQVVLQAPPSLDYVPGPEEPEQAPPLPDLVPEPVYPEFMPPEDEEDDDKDPEEDPTNYPADGGDDGDDEDESSDDDEDDDVDIEGDEEEEEHPAPVDSTAVAFPAVEHAPSAEETEPFETDESAATPPPHPVARLLAIPTLPPSPLSPWSSPLPRIPLPPLPVSPPLHVSPLPLPASPTYLLGYRTAMIRLRAEALSTSYSPPPHIILSHTRADTPLSGTPPLLPIPVPTSSPSLLLPSADHGADRTEVCLPPRKRLCFAFGPRYEVGESSSAPTARSPRGFRVYYGFVATIDREIMRDLERDVGYEITDT